MGRQGNKFIKSIIGILIFILLAFLAYEIIIEDVFDIFKEKNPIATALINQSQVQEKEIENESTNIEQIPEINPITDEKTLLNNEVLKESNHYYYNQLDETAKIIYKGFEDNIENMQTGTYKIDFNTQFNKLLNQEGGDKKLNYAFQSAWNAFTYDYVGIFYIDVTKLILTTQKTSIAGFSTYKVHLSNGENANYLSNEFQNETYLKEAKQELEELKGKIEKILDGYSDYEKIKYLHDWMINNLNYDTTYHRANIYNIYGALKNGTTVCEGYARSFKYILDDLGIESVLVSGDATNSNGETESHAWNYVKLEGKWYAIDLTWDDPIIINGGTLTDEARYRYFLRGSDTFFENHLEDGNFSENSMKFTFPTIEKQDYEL